MAKAKPSPRAAAWIKVLADVERVIQTTLEETAGREELLIAAESEHDAGHARLAQFSERFQALWLRAGGAEKEATAAESALVTAERDLREWLDQVIACRQNLAQWLHRAVG